jgi:hypothetical protein
MRSRPSRLPIQRSIKLPNSRKPPRPTEGREGLLSIWRFSRRTNNQTQASEAPFGSVLRSTTMALISAKYSRQGRLTSERPRDLRIDQVCRQCARCGQANAILELRRYPGNNAVGLFCTRCNGLNRDVRGNLFIKHERLRSRKIEPSTLPRVSQGDSADEFLSETANLFPGAVITRDTRPNGVDEGEL